MDHKPKLSITIQIFGPAVAYDDSDNRISSVKILRQLDGIIHDEDECSNYFEFGDTLDNAEISGGAIGLSYNATKRRLEVICTYTAARKLKAIERTLLLAETSGQLSDGIGEGCFDPVPGHPNTFVDVWPRNARTPLRLIQTGIAKASSKRKLNLWAIAKNGDTEGIVEALDAGANINELAKGFAPLHLAIGSGHVEAVRILLERGASVSRRDSTDFTPLHSCIGSSRIKGTKKRQQILELLIEAGADVNANSKHAGKPLPMANSYCRGKQLKATLIAHGATE